MSGGVAVMWWNGDKKKRKERSLPKTSNSKRTQKQRE